MTFFEFFSIIRLSRNRDVLYIVPFTIVISVLRKIDVAMPYADCISKIFFNVKHEVAVPFPLN